MQRLIDANKLMEYCQNQVIKTVDCNDIARFPAVLTIPDNPMNGDVIKAQFGNSPIDIFIRNVSEKVLML